jgi:cytidylate kinase
MYASAVSAIPRVRRRLAGMQRELALAGGGVLEGRDIGTHVVPETPHRFFLSARPDVRAARRHRELAAKGTPQPFDQVLAELQARDSADSTRADSPLVLTPGHREVDTSDLTIDEVVAALAAAIG